MDDAEIKERAKSAQWERFVFTLSGEARRVALVFDRGYEDVDFRTIDVKTDVTDLGKQIAENWRQVNWPEEEPVTFVRAFELGPPKGEHILMINNNQGEMFRCRCGRIVPGRFSPNCRTGDLPYTVISPSGNPKECEAFWRPCKAQSSKLTILETIVVALSLIGGAAVLWLALRLLGLILGRSLLD